MSASLLTKASLVLILSLVGLLYQQMYSAVDENMRTQRTQSIDIDRLINTQVLMTASLKEMTASLKEMTASLNAASKMSHVNQKAISKLEQKVDLMNAHSLL
jgi:hypothetical protein